MELLLYRAPEAGLEPAGDWWERAGRPDLARRFGQPLVAMRVRDVREAREYHGEFFFLGPCRFLEPAADAEGFVVRPGDVVVAW